MSVRRARISSSLIRSLVRRFCSPAAADLFEGADIVGSSGSFHLLNCNESLLTTQVLPRGLGGFWEFKFMASTIAEADVSAVIEEKANSNGYSTTDVSAVIEELFVQKANGNGYSTTIEADMSAVIEEKANCNGYSLSALKTPQLIFVLGGPGSGKGTQCAKIVENFGFTHLSAGDLLRAEINSGNENGIMIQNMIKEGKIVPSEVTVKLLQKAMLESGNDKFLIDGFPRNEENRAAFELVTGIKPEFILFFDCPEEEMEKRLLGRNQGRVDDNIETIRKRFKVFVESSLPVISHYESIGKVRKIDAARTPDEVFETVRSLFVPLTKVNT